MATKEAGLDSEQFSKEFLECPLCFEKFKEPKVLPCQHSFCLQCLRDYVTSRGKESTIPCPLCKKNTSIPDNDVSKFPNNFTLSNLTDFEKGAVQNPHLQCDACDEVRSLETFCSTCEWWLCRSCTTVHKKVPSSSSHCLSTNMEVNEQCIEIVSDKEMEVNRLQEEIKQKLTCLEETKEKVHSNVDDAKQQIKSAAEAAHQDIHIKENNLLQELSKFEEKEIQNQTLKCDLVKEMGVTIDNISQVINDIKESSSGRENQGNIEVVENFLTNNATNPSLPVSLDYIPVYFASRNFLGDLKNMDMGYLENINTCMLIERPVGLQEITSQGLGGPVYSLAYNKITDMLLAVVVRFSVIVINPDSGEFKPFLSPLSKREMVCPLCVAYSEDGRRLFVIEEEEGKGVITSYTHDGMFDSIITSTLTWPTGLVVYGGCIFVCDRDDECVCILNMSGEVLKVLKETPDHEALFTRPLLISVERNGRFAVTDLSCRVHIFDKDHTLLYTYAPDIAGLWLADVQVLPDGSVVVVDPYNGIHYISPDFSRTGLMNIENIASLSLRSITIHEISHTIYIGSNKGNIYSIKY